MKIYLAKRGDPYAASYEFGSGPNWRLRIIKKVLAGLGFGPELAKHGFVREVFLCQLAKEATNSLQNRISAPDYSGLLSVSEVSELAIDRWMVPRSVRKTDFLVWQPEDFRKYLTPTQESFHCQSNGLRTTQNN